MHSTAPDRTSAVPPKNNAVIELAARRPVGLLMIAVAVFVFGLISLSRLPMDLMPDVSYPTITVRTSYPGAAPEDVEDRVSRRLEQGLSVVKGLRRITSSSRAESSDVILEFGWDTDMKSAVQEVREKLDQTFLPDDAEQPTILRYDPTLDPVLQVGLSLKADGDYSAPGRDSDPLKWIRRVAEEEVERALESVSGVAAVKVRGGLEEEIRIEVDEERIRSRGITLALISQRLREENLDQASGLLEEGDVAYVVRTLNEFRTLDEIARIPLRRDGDSVTRLNDVATLVTGYREQRIITRIGGEPAVKIEVFREAGANIVELVKRVDDRLFGTAAEQEQFKRWRQQQQLRGAADDDTSDSNTSDSNTSDKKPDAVEGEATTAIDGAGDAPASTETGTGEPQSSDSQDAAAENQEGSEEPIQNGVAAGAEAGNSQGRWVSRPNIVVARLPEEFERPQILSDQSTFIESSIRDLYQTAVLGGLLAILVLFVFLGRLSYTAIVTVSIPFSIVATFAPMHMGGLSLNIMSLGGLALGMGMLVDSSIVVLEAIFRRRQEGAGVFEAAVSGASEVSGAVVASTLTTVAVFFPIVFVEGIAGQVFRDQALTVVFSLLASLVASLTLIPMLAARLEGARQSDRRVARHKIRFRCLQSLLGPYRRRGWRLARNIVFSPYFFLEFLLRFATELLTAVAWILYLMMLWGTRGILWGLVALLGPSTRLVVRVCGRGVDRLEHAYSSLLELALVRRWGVMAIAAASLVVAYAKVGDLGSELIPQVAQGELTLRLAYPVGTPIAVTERRIHEFELALTNVEGVANVATTIGVDPEEVQTGDDGEHTARLLVRFDPGDQKPEVVERRFLSQVDALFQEPDCTLEVIRPALFTFKDPIEVEVRGHDLAQLRRTALQVSSLMQTMPALEDIRSNIARGHPEYHLFPDREKMARLNVSSQQLADVLRLKNMGEVATRYQERERKIDVRVQLHESDRDSIEDLLALVVTPGAGGGGWTVGDLILGFEEREGPAEIRRVAQQRAAVISAGLRGVDLGSVAADLEDRLLREVAVDLPPEVSVEVVGQKKEMERSSQSLLGALLLAIFLVYVVMASQFESLLQPLVILFTIPLAGVGVVVTLWLVDTPLSIMAFIGMIMLTGIVVNNAIVLIDQVNRLRSEGVPLQQALRDGARRRLRPILMTTLTTVLGMIPVTGVLSQISHPETLDWLLGTGQGAEIRAPLAYTVIGGLLSSTLLTLFVIPVVYSLVVRERQPHSSGVTLAVTEVDHE